MWWSFLDLSQDSQIGSRARDNSEWGFPGACARCRIGDHARDVNGGTAKCAIYSFSLELIMAYVSALISSDCSPYMYVTRVDELVVAGRGGGG